MNSKLINQLLQNKSNKERKNYKEPLSKEKNLNSSRRKFISNIPNNKQYNKNSQKSNNLNQISSFNLKTDSSKRKNIIFNAKKMYNYKKMNIKQNSKSKNEAENIITKSKSKPKCSINNSNPIVNLSFNSIKSDKENKNNNKENKNNKSSKELILPSNNQDKKVVKKNRNILTQVWDDFSSKTYSNNFKANKSNNNLHDKKLIKVNLITKRKTQKKIIKEASYAMSNTNTNSNTNNNSRSIYNYLNENRSNKANKVQFLDIINFNKDINQIINIKESIAFLKRQLKISDSDKNNNNVVSNKIKSKPKDNKLKINNYQKYTKKSINTRNDSKSNNLETSETLNKIKKNNINFDNIKNKKKIFIRSNKTKSNLNNILYISKEKNSSLSSKRYNNKTSNKFYSHRKNYLRPKNSSKNNIANISKKNNSNSQKSYKKANKFNNTQVYKFIKKGISGDIYNFSISSASETYNLENKIKKINKNKFLNITENNSLSNNNINPKNDSIKKILLNNIIKNNSNILISSSNNNSIMNDNSNLKNNFLNQKKNNLKFKYYKNKIRFSFDIKLYLDENNKNNSGKILLNKSQFLIPLYKNKSPKDNNDEINKKIEQIELISKAGEPIFGQKKINQDNYFCNDLTNRYKFIGVCDGHGENGHHVSEFIKNNLPIELDKRLRQTINLENILNCFQEVSNKSKLEFIRIKEILKQSFMITNSKLLSKHNINFNLRLSGSTCVSVLMDTENLNKLYISNIGDSRALIIKEMKYKYWTCQQLSRDHKPTEKDESSRIYRSGGEIQKVEDEEGWTGPLRVWAKNGDGPGLAMTRSFGDILGSSIGIICIPEITEYIIKKEDKVIIIASDGLWEYISNKETTDIVKKSYNKKEPNRIVNQLYKEAYKKWRIKDKGIDDITIICIILKS